LVGWANVPQFLGAVTILKGYLTITFTQNTYQYLINIGVLSRGFDFTVVLHQTLTFNFCSSGYG